MSEVVFEDKKILRFLKGLEKKSSKIEARKREYTQVLSAVIYKHLNRNFENEMGPDGSWRSKPWSDSYQTFMEKMGKSGNKYLQDNGRLKQGILPIKYDFNIDTKQSGILWFNNVKYAAIHNYGGPMKNGGTMPKREFMWLSNEGLEEVSEQTLKFILSEK